MIEKLRQQIDKLENVGQHAFNGTDYSFGFNTWRSGTLTLLRRLFPDEKDIIKQIKDIYLYRADTNRKDASGYNLIACKDEAREILQTLIESLEIQAISSTPEEVETDFWVLLHPRVFALTKTRFDNGLFADAVLTCLREINTIVKDHVRSVLNQEIDGAPLMTRAFSIQNPIIELADMSTESGRNIQLGYMKIFEGAMIGVRNPKAHANLYLDKKTAIHLLFLASFMFDKLQNAGLLNEE